MNRRDYSVVVPSVGRPSLALLLDALCDGVGPPPREVIVVDDRPPTRAPLVVGPLRGRLAGTPLRLVAGGGRGPAHARNVGWRAARGAWVAFLDDDVVPTYRWARDLADDLDDADGAEEPDGTCGGVQGRIVVPLPAHRRPTDAERGVAGLARARWATADLAYRRHVLEEVGGFDERFPRAYREDAELGLRVIDAGYRIRLGRHTSLHPTRAEPWWASVRRQVGNADDALMRRLHGRDWRARAGAPRGRRPQHLATTALGGAGLVALAAGRRRGAALAGAAWFGLSAELTARRVAASSRRPGEVAGLAASSLAIPPAASAAWLVGVARARRLVLHPAPGPRRPATPPAASALVPEPAATEPAAAEPVAARPLGAPPVAAVLFDRDGTLVVDVPYNGDPDRVHPVPGARPALDRLRAAGIRVAMITNQSGVARGLIAPHQVAAVNERVDQLLGPFDTILVCPHGDDDGCGCRKPAPGLVSGAARRLGLAPVDCVVVGDIGSDVEAAHRAGARAILVPTEVTRSDEVAAAITRSAVTADLGAAVEWILGDVRSAS